MARLGHVSSSWPCTGDACLEPVLAGGGVRLEAVEAGEEHTCGRRGQTAVCWGMDWQGQLGDAATVTQRCGEVNPLPCSVEPSAVGLGYPVVDITTGASHACALTQDGDGYCWGLARFDALGDGLERENTSIPSAIAGGHDFISITGGTSHTCAIDTQSRAWCWGSDREGRLGLGEPVPVPTSVPTPAPVVGDLEWTALDAGVAHTCGVTTSGAAYCFGQGYRGRLGDGQGQNSPIPVRVAIPGDDVTGISTGGTHACALTRTGAAWCWGAGSAGQLGVGPRNDAYVPVRVRSDERFIQISAGAQHTCAVTDQHRLYCWGDSNFGQLGVGDRADRLLPTLVD